MTKQAVVLLILVVALTSVGLYWRTEVGCFVFLALTLFIARFRSPPKFRRLLTVIWIVLAIALVVGIFLYRRLNTPDATTIIANNVLLRFLIGTTWSRVLCSAVTGLLVGICLVGGHLLVVMYIGSEWLMAMRETFGVTRRQALRLLFSVVFNMNYPYFIIEDGEIALAKPAGILELFGGPGVAVVKPCNAVVFEWGGEVTRIEGPGVYLTKLFEFPKCVIDLRPQWDSFEVEEVLTKDRVPLRIKGGVRYCIESKDQALRRIKDRNKIAADTTFAGLIEGQHPVFKFSIFDVTYRPAGPWRSAVVGMTRTQLREVLAEYELGQILRFYPEVEDLEQDQPILKQIAKEVKKRAAGIACNWGVFVGSVNIDTIEMPELIRQQMQQMWSAEFARQRALIEAETARILQAAKAKDRTETILALSRGLKQDTSPPSVQGEAVKTPEALRPDSPAIITPSSSLLERSAFQQLLFFARRGQCRLFIGSGVSSEAGMPGVQVLQGTLREELREMGSSVPRDVTLPELATTLKKVAGRTHLIHTLQSIFYDALQKQPPPWKRGAYPCIPHLPQELVNVVYTSNWDDLLKRAFEEAGQAAREIRHPGGLSLISQAENAVVKVHRDFLSPDGPVVSETDYTLARNDIQQGTAGTLWGHLADQMARFRFVFVGYGLGDPTLDLIRRVVELRTGTTGERRHFLVGPLSAEEAQAAKRWAGVLPIITVASDFFQTLVQALQE